ncbi:hypothetical protein KP509_17G037900 [Ceratopteris richardii]|nr:hypothetical protein KP509_17G037900 [Ceratopteris richardii]
MDRQILGGREITVVFAEENRKRPEEMRMKERGRGRMAYGGGRRLSPNRGHSPYRSPRYRSPSPRDSRYSRSYDGPSRNRYDSVSPPPRGRNHISRSPEPYRREKGYSPVGEAIGSPVRDVHPNSDGYRKRGRHSASSEKSYSPRSPRYGEASPDARASPARFRQDSRSRSRSFTPQSPLPRRQRHPSLSVSPRSRSPPPRRQRHAVDSRDVHLRTEGIFKPNS